MDEGPIYIEIKQKMLNTRLLTDKAEIYKWLEWIDKASTFRDLALWAFGEEIENNQYKPLSNGTYYIVVDYTKPLLLIKTTPLGSALGLSFSRIFNKVPQEKRGIEAHLWLKNALEEKVIQECFDKGFNIIQAAAFTDKGKEVCHKLSRLKIGNVDNIHIGPGTHNSEAVTISLKIQPSSKNPNITSRSFYQLL